MHIGCVAEAQFKSSDGRYYKKLGKFWFVYQQGGWHAISGEPTGGALTPLGKNHGTSTT